MALISLNQKCLFLCYLKVLLITSNILLQFNFFGTSLVILIRTVSYIFNQIVDSFRLVNFINKSIIIFILFHIKREYKSKKIIFNVHAIKRVNEVLPLTPLWFHLFIFFEREIYFFLKRDVIGNKSQIKQWW